MILTIKEIVKIFDLLISHKITREDADLWASEIYKKSEYEKLLFDPIDRRQHIEDSLTYLYGIDIKVSKDTYLHTDEEIIEFYQTVVLLKAVI
jgi:hypothetical protein